MVRDLISKLSQILMVISLFSCTNSLENDDFAIVLESNDGIEFEISKGERPIDLEPTDWVLDEKLSDQFELNDIDPLKWEKNPNDWGPWSWEPDNVFSENNILNLRIRYEEHTDRGMNLFYKSGIIRSKDTLTYGYVEAKIKGLPIYPTASPAFWLYSIGSELDKWGLRGSDEGHVRYSEIDVVEMLQGNWDPVTKNRYSPELMDCNLHVSLIENGKEVRKRPRQFPELLKTEYIAQWDPRDDYHTYGALIAPNKISFYIDGVQIAEKPNLYWHLPVHVTLSLGLRYPHVTYNNCPDDLWRCAVPEAASKENFPSSMKVDWVRVYRKK